ncbi:MAG: hypothetical protein JO181_17410, partial [Solirubrobacterales bacterium]|nr:hypothetical protein [Solirubrobacterales bacterium]
MIRETKFRRDVGREVAADMGREVAADMRREVAVDIRREVAAGADAASGPIADRSSAWEISRPMSELFPTLTRKRRRGALTVIATIATAGAIAACGGSSDTTSTSGAAATSSGAKSGSDTQLALVAYSTPKKAYDALTGAFAQTSAGEGV